MTNRTGERQLPMTESRKASFLVALRDSGGIFSTACRVTSPHSKATGATPPCYSTWRGLLERDAEFSAQVEEILEQCRDDVEAEIMRRGQEGWLDPVYMKGQRVMDTDEDGRPVKATIRRFSDTLLMARARALMPNKYSDKRQHSVVHSGTVTHAAGLSMADIRALSPAERDQVEQAFTLLQRTRGGSDGEPRALTHNPPEILDADYETVEDTMAALEAIEREDVQ